MHVLCGISLLPAEDVRVATAPLFDAGVVDAVEWSLDFGFGEDGIAPWIARILDDYEARGAVFAHGVELSPMSALLLPHQEAWLAEARSAFERRKFRHLTEHYGFMTAGDIVRGTPLPLPPSTAALKIAIERVGRLQEIARGPVGIENLAMAFGREDALAQADLVRELCDRTGAFLLLDVHNLFCQAFNFDLDPLALAERYGLDRVREIHVAGGGATYPSADPSRPFRRDSHDHDVPEPAFALLAALLPRTANLEVVILERSDRSLFSELEGERYRADFGRMRSLVHEVERADTGPITTRPRDESPGIAFIDDEPAELDAYQRAMLEALTADGDAVDARRRLVEHPGAVRYSAHVHGFEQRAVEVGAELAREWCARDIGPTQMAAAVFRRKGSPLELTPLPIPSAGPGQLLIRPLAVGLCGTDLHAHAGRFPVPTPIVLGHEVAGIVEEVGEGAAGFLPGDRVGISWIQRGCGACPGCARGEETRCTSPITWIENGGGLSELVVAEASGATKLPPNVDFEIAAPLFCGGHVAMSAYRRASPRPGERIAVLGLGGLGHLSLMIARAMGHEVVVVTSRADKAKDACALGAAEAVVTDDPGEALQSMGGADIILAMTSSMRDAGSAARGLAEGGRLVLAGLGDGALELDPVDLVLRQASVVGAIQGPRKDLEDVLDLAARGSVTPRIETFPLHLVNRAMTRLAEGRVRYRAVVTFG
jgi:D-arabinose 1-dehydrogenase-like Zn-dependent alcohol dehydrogenase/uncharacterized protein (UPF0276 family)